MNPNKKFANQIRAAKRRFVDALHKEGYIDIKTNSKIRVICETYSKVFNVPLLKERKYWHIYFLLEVYNNPESKAYKGIKLPLKRNQVSKWKTYNAYMKSYKWFKFSSSIKEARGNKCEECDANGENVILHAHHLTYERLMDELPEDIQVLCKPCHRLKHTNKRF